jgi:CubicO group peptidase (beta-lactamase class C family)
MKKGKRVTILIGVILLSWFVMFTVASARQVNIVVPESVGMSSDRLATIDKMAEKAVEEKYFKGVIVLVARHGKLCYFKAFGEAEEGKPMKTDAVFRLASMTKTPSVVALLQFWDQGRFQLKDPVSKFIPEFKDLQVAEMDENGEIKLVPAKRQITIHDLLSFTGGLSATYLAGLGPIHKYVAEKYAEAGVQDLMNETYTNNLEQNVKAIAICPLIFQPGEAWCYNQTGLDTMAYLVEIFSGKPFDQYLAEHIFDPLGAKEIWFYPPEEVFSRIPAVYDKPGELVKLTEAWSMGAGMMGPNYTFGKNKAYFSAGGGLHGTTYDFYKFAQMLLNKGEYNGVRILSRQAVEVMTTVQVGDGPNYRNIFSNNRWGYGVDIQKSAQMSPLNDWYGGPGSYGWRGFWSTMYFNDPIDDTVVMTMAQTPRHGYSWGSKVSVVAGAAIID